MFFALEMKQTTEFSLNQSRGEGESVTHLKRSAQKVTGGQQARGFSEERDEDMEDVRPLRHRQRQHQQGSQPQQHGVRQGLSAGPPLLVLWWGGGAVT